MQFLPRSDIEKYVILPEMNDQDDPVAWDLAFKKIGSSNCGRASHKGLAPVLGEKFCLSYEFEVGGAITGRFELLQDEVRWRLVIMIIQIVQVIDA